MKKTACRKLLIILLLLPTQPVFAEKEPSTMYEKVGVEEHLGEFVDLNLEFKNQLGELVKLKDLQLENRPMIITPVYFRCPRLCTLTLNAVVEVLNKIDLKLGKDFTLVAASFNKEETPKLAKEKAEAYRPMLSNLLEKRDILEKGDVSEKNTEPWHFLTGNEENISKLMQQLGFNYRPDGKDFSHTSVFMILSPQGKISRYFYGIKHQERDVHLSLIEAAKGNIGSTIDKILLYCFRFDPTKGQYTLAVLNVTRVISLAVFAGLTTLLFGMRIKEKRDQNRA